MNHMFSEEQISALVQNIPKYVYIKIALTNRIKSGELEVGQRKKRCVTCMGAAV